MIIRILGKVVYSGKEKTPVFVFDTRVWEKLKSKEGLHYYGGGKLGGLFVRTIQSVKVTNSNFEEVITRLLKTSVGESLLLKGEDLEGLNWQLDERQPNKRTQRFLRKHFFFDDEKLLKLYLYFYAVEVAEDSAIPHERAMIKFREYYIETTTGWILRPGTTPPEVIDHD